VRERVCERAREKENEREREECAACQCVFWGGGGRLKGM